MVTGKKPKSIITEHTTISASRTSQHGVDDKLKLRNKLKSNTRNPLNKGQSKLIGRVGAAIRVANVHGKAGRRKTIRTHRSRDKAQMRNNRGNRGSHGRR